MRQKIPSFWISKRADILENFYVNVQVPQYFQGSGNEQEAPCGHIRNDLEMHCGPYLVSGFS